MNKLGLYISLFCLSASLSSFSAWLISLSAIAQALSFWLLFVIILLAVSSIIFDDAVKAILNIENDNLYYGGIIFTFISILLGVTLIWICS